MEPENDFVVAEVDQMEEIKKSQYYINADNFLKKIMNQKTVKKTELMQLKGMLKILNEKYPDVGFKATLNKVTRLIDKAKGINDIQFIGYLSI